jgi:hypothetical protein
MHRRRLCENCSGGDKIAGIAIFSTVASGTPGRLDGQCDVGQLTSVSNGLNDDSGCSEPPSSREVLSSIAEKRTGGRKRRISGRLTPSVGPIPVSEPAQSEPKVR